MRTPGFIVRLLAARLTAVYPQPVTGRRIFILPTRSGIVFGVILLAMLVAAINHTNNLAFLLTFLLASIAIVSSIHTYANLAGMVLVQARIHPVFCGEEARLHLVLDAGARERSALRIRIGDGTAILVSLSALERREVELVLPTVQRGNLPAGTVTLSTRFPLGLFRAWSPSILPTTGVIYARPISTELSSLAGQGQDYAEQAVVSANSGEFGGLRPYRPEDGISRVSWKASARGSGMQAKEFQSGAAHSIFLDWDQVRGFGYEERISRLTGMVREAERSGLQYALRIPGFVSGSGSGPGHAHVCLEALALMPEER